MRAEQSEPFVAERRPVSMVSAASKGVFWLLGQTAASRILQALVQIVLAWLLTPADFGQVSLALAVATIVSAFFSLGLEDVLLQRHKALRLWIDTVFWLSFTIGLIGGVALLAAAPIAALIYDQPHLAGLISIAALGAPIASLETIPGTIIRSRLNFRVLSIVALSEALAAGGMSIVLAALGFGAYSLVLPSPIAAAGRVCILWLLAKPKIRMPRARRRWRLLMPNASASLGSRLLNILMGQADYIILGLVAREIEVGVYYFAYKVAIQPLRMLAGSLSAVLFPALVHYRDDPTRQLDAALLASQMLSIVVMPACFLQAALAGPVLRLFFGSKWDGAELLIQLLSIGFAFDASSWAAGALLNARGEFRRGFFYMLLAAPVFVIFITIGAVTQRETGVAVAVAIYFILVQPTYCYFAFTRSGAVDWRDIARIYLAPVLTGAATVAGASILAEALYSAAWFQLCFVPLAALAVYVPLIRVFCPRSYRFLRERAFAFRARSPVRKPPSRDVPSSSEQLPT
jgi:PST family polysaccharide transporter